MLRIAHCGGLHIPQLNKLIDALNFVAKLLHRPIHWDTETLGCVPSLSSIPSMEQRLLVDALQVCRRRGPTPGTCSQLRRPTCRLWFTHSPRAGDQGLDGRPGQRRRVSGFVFRRPAQSADLGAGGLGGAGRDASMGGVPPTRRYVHDFMVHAVPGTPHVQGVVGTLLEDILSVFPRAWIFGVDDRSALGGWPSQAQVGSRLGGPRTGKALAAALDAA